MMTKPKIFIAGHKGMVGSAILRLLNDQDVEIITKDRTELNLLNQVSVQNFFENEKIDQVYLAAAKVGGIYANITYPANFIYENLMIQNNVIHNAYLNGVKKLLFLGSSCIYPRNINKPIKEEDLLSGKFESTNEAYAIAKIAGIKMCESYNRQFCDKGIDFRCIMPTNLYGPGDSYHKDNSHVIPGLIRRFHDSKINNDKFVKIWGTGKPKRDFLFVDDMAAASVFLMNISRDIYLKNTSQNCSHINAGSGSDLSIRELSEMIKEIVEYKDEIIFDETKPDGNPKKILDNSVLKNLGWKAKISLKEGLYLTYKEFQKSEFRD